MITVPVNCTAHVQRKQNVGAAFYTWDIDIDIEGSYTVPLGSRLDNFVGLLSQLHHPGLLQPDVSGVQSVHTGPGIDRLASYETQTGCGGRIDGLKLQQVSPEGVERMVLAFIYARWKRHFLLELA